MSNEYFEYLAKLASDLSRRTSQLDEMMQALYNVNLSIRDREKLKNMINHMAKFNKSQPSANPPAQSPTKVPTLSPIKPPAKSPVKPPAKSPVKPPVNNPTATPLASGQKSDLMYDLFNSPAMMSIIKEIYNKKKKK